MIHFNRLGPWVVAMAISYFSAASYALDPLPGAGAAAARAATGGEGATVAADLAAQVRAAKDPLPPRQHGETAAVRQRLSLALATLDRYLATGGANGRAWKRFLLWDEMQAELRKPASPDLAELERVYRRFASDHAGLELPVWRNVALALRTYIDLAAALADPQPQATYEMQLGRLADGLEAYAMTSAPEALDAAAVALGRLERAGQALPLVRQVRERLSQPNLYVNISEEFIAAGTGRLIDEVEPVRDAILGTQISGQGRTAGHVQVKLVPSANRAVLETILEAVNDAQTVGVNGPARIGSNTRTVLFGRQPLAIDAEGFHALPGLAAATANSQN